MIDIKAIETIINYTFKNKNLLVQAFTHPSYGHASGMLDNDRMEFMGDAILDDVVSIYIYNAYPQLDAGELTKLRASIVSSQGLKPVVREMGLLKYLLVADGADVIKRLGKKIEADLFESVLGAIYLDGGYREAERFVLHFLKDILENRVFEESQKDYKTPLQEYCQARKWKIDYRFVTQSGPQDKLTFTFALYINDEFCCEGSGLSKKSAQQDAAKKYCTKWRID